MLYNTALMTTNTVKFVYLFTFHYMLWSFLAAKFNKQQNILITQKEIIKLVAGIKKGIVEGVTIFKESNVFPYQ